MLEVLQGVEERYNQIEGLLADPDIVSDQEKYTRYAREHAELSRVVPVYRRYKEVLAGLEESRELLRDSDPDMRELAREEYDRLEGERDRLERELKVLLLPKDPNDEKNVVLEIRAGTGGEEAALFAADLFRMYSRYAEDRKWSVEVLVEHPSATGGLKEVAALVKGKGAYSVLKYESGIHRVQRVPATEAQGRIHTSAVTVAVLPEAEEVDVDIDPSDLRIDVFRSQGCGGQHVNTTDSAVRITHLPTGLVVTCQDEKSQHKNKAKAMKVLRARLLNRMLQEQEEKIAETRKNQVGTGDRSGRIRTYNFPQGRVTDHRIGLTVYKLDQILDGQFQEITDALITHFQAKALENAQAG
ncbi:MAG: peptide chain release factor 1 [Deltaproteobacteria bacterium]|nr:peptide chain release factor 1 [Deltaproteobacteria bacterium]